MLRQTRAEKHTQLSKDVDALLEHQSKLARKNQPYWDSNKARAVTPLGRLKMHFGEAPTAVLSLLMTVPVFLVFLGDPHDNLSEERETRRTVPVPEYARIYRDSPAFEL